MVQRCHDARELGYVQLGWFILFYKFVSFVQSSTCFPLENCIWKPKSPCEIGQGHGKPLQYSFLEKPMGRGAWGSTVHGVTKSWTQLSERAHTHTHTHTHTHMHSMWENLPNNCDSKFEVFLSTPDHPKCWQMCKVSQIFTTCVGHISCYNIFPE